MSFDLIKLAKNHGFDEAYLIPGIYVKDTELFGLSELRDIMPKAESVLLLIKKHNPFGPFPEGTMSIHSHYPLYHKVYFLHKSLIEKLNAIGIAAESADMLPLKPYAEAAGMQKLKNSLMYHKGYGTYFVMQAIAVDVDSELLSAKKKDYCKNCTKCIDACPTGAIGKDGVVNITKCVRNHVPVKDFIPEKIRNISGTSYIGCGICQKVCPLNKGIKKIEPPEEIFAALNIGDMLDLKNNKTQIKKLRYVIGNNEARPGRTIATACMAAGNSGDRKYVPYLETILTQYINPLARGYAAWAMGKIGGCDNILKKALENEHNAQVKSEIISAIAYKSEQ